MKNKTKPIQQDKIEETIEEKLYVILQELQCLDCNKQLGDCTSCNWDSIYDEILFLFQKEIRKQGTKILKELKRIKKQTEYQDYGWSDLEDDLEKLIEELE